jgi:hypothetical protein
MADCVGDIIRSVPAGIHGIRAKTLSTIASITSGASGSSGRSGDPLIRLPDSRPPPARSPVAASRTPNADALPTLC